MNTKKLSMPAEAREDQKFLDAFSAVKRAREIHVRVRPHRAITALRLTPWLLAQTVILPVLFCAFLIWAKPMLLDFWRGCILFWSAGVGVPFFRSTYLNDAGQYALIFSGANEAALMPSAETMLITTLVAALALLVSFRMKGASLPLKYPVRIACVVQLGALLYFWLSPGNFPYTIARHSEELMTIGYVTIVATPVMLAMGYYILNESVFKKLLNSVLIILFLAVMVPHQVVIQALIMQHASVLFMPVLYICFGAVFDALVFVALYSWVASNVSSSATL